MAKKKKGKGKQAPPPPEPDPTMPADDDGFGDLEDLFFSQDAGTFARGGADDPYATPEAAGVDAEAATPPEPESAPAPGAPAAQTPAKEPAPPPAQAAAQPEPAPAEAQPESAPAEAQPEPAAAEAQPAQPEAAAEQPAAPAVAPSEGAAEPGAVDEAAQAFFEEDGAAAKEQPAPPDAAPAPAEAQEAPAPAEAQEAPAPAEAQEAPAPAEAQSPQAEESPEQVEQRAAAALGAGAGVDMAASPPAAELETPAETAPEGTWEEVLQYLASEVASTKKKAGKAMLLFETSRVQSQKLGNWDQAEEFCRKALEQHDKQLSALRELVKICAARENWPEAVGYLTQQAQIVSDPAGKAAALLASAHIRLSQLGDEAGAEVDLGKALEHTPNNYIALRFLREIYYRQEDWNKLVDILGRAGSSAEGAQQQRVLYELGRLHDEVLRKPIDAAPYFEQCLKQEPRFIPAFLALERIYSRAEEWAQLADLYQRIGEALGGADRLYWMTRAARIHDDQLDDADAAEAAYRDTLENGPEELAPRAEFRAFLYRRKRHDALVDWLQQEAEATDDETRGAAVQLQIGEIALEGLDDTKAARKAFDAALALDPDCAPAQEGKRLLLLKESDWDGLVEHYTAAREGTEDVRSQVAFSIKIGELHEQRRSDNEAAAKEYRHALDLAPNYLPARERLARVLGKLGNFEEQATVLETTASLLDGVEYRSATLYQAGRLFAEKVGNPERAIRCLELSMEAAPGLLLNLDVLVEAQLDAGKYKEAMETLRKVAGETEDPELKVSLLYRAAQIALGELGEMATAEECLRAILELSPAFLGAMLDLREILVRSGDKGAVAALEEQEATAGDNPRSRFWWRYSAARNYEAANRRDKARECFQATLKEAKDSEEAFHALGRLARLQKDELILADLYRDRLEATEAGPARTPLQLGLLETLFQLRDAESFAAVCQEALANAPQMPLPRTSLGMLCEGLELWSEALACYNAATERAEEKTRITARYQCGLLAEEFSEDAAAATECYQLVLDDDPEFAMALDGLERLYTQSGDREGLARLYGNQAASSRGNPVGTFYALLAGDLHHELSRFDAAAGFYLEAFEDPVGRERAFEALRRIYLRNRDGAALVELNDRLVGDLQAEEAISRTMELADGLVQIGDEERTIATYQAMLDQYEDLVVPAFHLKVLFTDRGDWNSVLFALETLQDRAVSKKVRDQVAAQIDGLLQEKFIDRPEAKPFFERLYEKDRKNPLALKGLGAISFKEEKYEDAFLYFDELKEICEDKPLKAIAVYHLGRIAEIKDGKTEDAVQAYEEALELDPELVGPLDALFELHSAEKNWQGLVGVLSRQASIARDKDKIGIYAEIARVWEEKIKDPDVAIKSWDRVLSLDPRQLEAYDRLLKLYEQQENHRKQIEIGRAKAEQMPEDRRAQLLYELGVVAEEKLEAEDTALTLFELSANCPGSHPDALAALRRFYTNRGEWDHVVELAGRQAELVENPTDRVDIYLERAQVRLNKQIDREAAVPDFRRVLELQPDNQAALAFFVDYHFDRQAWAEALPIFEAYQPVIDQMDVDEDDDILEEVTLFYFKFGQVHQHVDKDDPDLALACYNKALELSPTHIPSLREAAPRLFEKGDWKGASKYYKQILRLLGGFGDQEALNETQLNLGRCELRMGKADQAMKRFTKIIETNPKDIGALEGIAEVHAVNKDWNTLLSTYNSVIKFAKSAEQVIEAYLKKGDILEEKLGYSDKAALHYEKVLMYDKTNARAMRRLGEIAIVKGDLEKAQKWADVAVRTAAQQEDTAGATEGMLLQAISLAPSGEGMQGYLDQASQQANEQQAKAVVELKDGVAKAQSPADLLKTYRKHFAQL